MSASRVIVKLLVGIAIFVGLPLAAWGIKDLHGFWSHPARVAYAAVVVLLQVVILIKVPEAGQNRGQGRETKTGQRLVLLLLQVIPLAIVIAAPYGDRRDLGVFTELPMVRYLGLTLFALELTGMHWAEAILDKQFSVVVTIQPDHELVTHGPYRYLRHPRYLGIILFTAGFALVYRSWLGLVLVAALACVLMKRIRDEEGVMRKEFGTTWDAYVQRTWRLVPFLY
ncbi:MAG TPA: isoprenylcysteine carboxylmethyltransferase family protein [Clostridia bacterium]|nr:isoprenylcysteine carboxylmethyltransferase family protein [Clostridia bacterium]